ncbi:MAG: acyl-CoA dehydrogenase family protein [Thermoleophilia bacterium]
MKLSRRNCAKGLRPAWRRDYQLIRAKLVDIATSMEASKLIVYRTVCMIDNDIPCREEAFMTKMFATESCLNEVDQVTRIYGANGFASEFSPQRYFRDARFLLCGGGTHEIIRDFVGRQMVKGRWESKL